MTQYSSGFAISNNQVAVIRKLRPAWQAGLWNAIGGHCEPGEQPAQTMVREFQEETGYASTSQDWRLFAVLCGLDWMVYFYVSHVVPLDQLQSITDEPISIVNIADLNPTNSINNIAWLVRMAQVASTERANYFRIEEY